MAHYLFNSVKGDAAKSPPVPREHVAGFLRVRMWGIDAASRTATNAKADFQAGVVQITAHEYETALAVAAGRASSTG